ncbi:low affinity immunoglobulin gamma Fc region receptor II-like isoform X2 [Xiphophorus couchianus]|uniref:low affinity immunoglobulin gamma Fc region receptor II-like isoform X2 n=1 Tax=Xiphophorus couchianus TaxID=32473 RepID=UPI00101648AB|nr:low affinity immunoglobulin gamma Fc region receptor II-like isoform X2 [Xiphophorus couchianus]
MRMKHTLYYVLDILIWIIFVCCGHAQVSNKVFVTRQPNWPQMFSGESITLTCEVQGGETTEWTYEWRRDGSFIHRTQKKNLTFSVSESNGGDYRCLGFLKDDWFSSTEWSEPISLSVLRKPKAHLTTGSTELPVGGNVILTCSLNTSSSSSFSLKYFWYRGEKSSEPVSSQDADFLSNGQMSVSEEGLYWCRGGRGEPVYYTDYSDHVNITKNLSVESSGPVGSLLLVLLVVALLGGISLITLLLLFWCSRQMKDFRHVRLNPSQISNQSFTANHGVNHSEMYTSHPEVNNPSLSLSLGSSEVNRNNKSDTVYSLAELKTSGTKRSPPDPEEGALWSHVKTQAIGLSVGPEVNTVYGKVKKGATDKSINTVYSQIEGKNVGMMSKMKRYSIYSIRAVIRTVTNVVVFCFCFFSTSTELPVDPEEVAVYANVKKGAIDKSIDTAYSLTEMKNFGTMKDPHDPQEGAVGSDMKTDCTAASTEINHLKKAKKKTKGKRSRSADAAVYANESGTAVASDGPMSRKAKKH